MKCGTTALYEYLSQHPGVFMSKIKEPRFFCTDLKTNGGMYNANAYQQLFAAAPAGATTGEASAMYLYSQVAIQGIMAHNPNSKIIVMLRNPVDAAHSLYAARWGYRHETASTFEEAWRMQEARLRGEVMPLNWPEPLVFQYGPIFCYGEQIRRVLQHVPPEQRLFIIYEEFFSDPTEHYQKVLEFLNLSSHEPHSFRRVNATPGARSPKLERFMRKPPGWIKSIYRVARPLFPAEVLWKMNSVPRKAVLDPTFRTKLEAYFAADIKEVENLLDRRLWRKQA